MSTIEWTDKTWNWLVGCSRISSGCKNCYAAEAAKSARLQQFPQYQKVKDWNGVVEFVESQLYKPLSWKQPQRVFTCSMSDIFHESVHFGWIERAFEVMHEAKWHTFQILTKRPQRMLEFFGWYARRCSDESVGLQWQPDKNVWIGVSVENQEAASDRIPLLLQTPAVVRFLSCEPMLEKIDLTTVRDDKWQDNPNWHPGQPMGTMNALKLINWVICGGESGSKARACHIDWVRSLVQQCQSASVPVFVKQLGSNAIWLPPDLGSTQIASSPCINGYADTHYQLKLKDRKGGNIDEFPEDLRIRELPD